MTRRRVVPGEEVLHDETPAVIGLVLVAHRVDLARAAAALAADLVPTGAPALALAAGAADGTLGTEPDRIAAALAEVDGPEGVLMLVDLPTALPSVEAALERCGPLAARVCVSSAPFVEGLLVAVVTAAGGADLETVDREARGAAHTKAQLLGRPALAGPGELPPSARYVDAVLANRRGMHARPAAMVVRAVQGLDAAVSILNLSTGIGPKSVASLLGVISVGGRPGERLRFGASGPDAAEALRRLAELVETGFGEDLERRARS